MRLCNKTRGSIRPSIVIFTVLTLFAAATNIQTIQANWTLDSAVRLNEQAPWSSYELDQAKALDRCQKDPRTENEFCYSWRHRYIDEQNDEGNDVRLLDKTIDERVANSIYTALSLKVVNFDFLNFNSGDAALDEANLASVMGPQVDDKLCSHQLLSILQMLAQWEKKLEQERQNGTDKESMMLQLEEKHIRLARVLDSFGRYESGLMLGRSHSIGSFDQCRTSRLLLPTTQNNQEQLVKTRFCWARMDIGRHLNEQLRTRKPGPFELEQKLYSVGICLPESCHSRSFTPDKSQFANENLKLVQQLIDTQFRMPKSLFLDETLKVDSIYCLVDDQSPFGISFKGKLLIVFLISWILLTIYATYYFEQGRQRSATSNKKNDDEEQKSRDPKRQASWMHAFLDCLDLRKSWQDFVEEPYDDEVAKKAGEKDVKTTQRVQFDVMNPVKVFGCGYVVLGHSLIMQTASTMDTLRAYNFIENDPSILSMIIGTVVVDTFFVITGVLMAYVAMRRTVRAEKTTKMAVTNGQTNGKYPSENNATKSNQLRRDSNVFIKLLKNWYNFIVQRHLRLVPLFFLVYWFKRSVFIDAFGRGQPLWDNGFNKDTPYGACKQEPWYTPLTILAAYLPLSKQCLPQAWSIASDLFFSITVTPIVLILTKRPRLALYLGLLVSAVSYGYTVKAYYSVPDHLAMELSHVRAHGFVYMFGELHHLYTYPQFRLISVLSGVVAGYALHLYQEAEQTPVWPQWIRGWATKLSLSSIVSLFVVVSVIPRVKIYMTPYEQEMFTHLFTSGRVLWALCNSIVLIRMATDWKDNFLMKQFASKYWSKLVKLNLAILLIHMDILIFQMGNSRSLNYFSMMGIFNLFSSTYLCCIPLAILLHIVFENPIDKIIRRYVLPKILAT